MSWPDAGRSHPGPLRDVRVLDLSAFAVGPWAAGCLSALGADVIKVDPPYGDPIRRVRPLHSGEPTTYTVCNLGKRCMAVDLKDEAERGRVLELAASADVIVENHRAGAMERLGLGYADVRRVNPRIVYCSSGSYGDRGPLATVGSTDPHGQAFSGFVSINGAENGRPEFLRYSALVDLATSGYILAGALIGLHRRDATGAGCHVVTSQLEAATGLQTTRLIEFLASGAPPGPMGSASGAVAPSRAFRCRDGRYLNVTAPTDALWVELCAAIERPELAEDGRFRTNALRLEHAASLHPLLEPAFAARDLLWWRRRLDAIGVPNGACLLLDDALAYPEAHPLGGFLERVPHPRGDTLLCPRPAWTFARTPARLAVAPLPGEHTEALREALAGAGRAVGEPSAAAGAAPVGDGGTGRQGGELADLAVVEIGQGVAVPYCGWLLAGLGAQVVKLEPPGGDPGRRFGPPASGGAGAEGAAYAALNEGKAVLRGDWQSPEGRRRLRELVRRADVLLVDRGRSGLPPVCDLSSEELESSPALEGASPGLVICGVSPVGEDGPLAASAATELELQGLSGLLRYLGGVGEPPVRLGADVAGIATGTAALCGVLGALHERGRSGRGQRVDVSALGCLLNLGAVMIAALDRPDAWEGFHCLAAGFPPIHGIETANGLLSFSAPRKQREWREFLDALGAQELAGHPDYATDEQRLFRSRELNWLIEPYCRRFTREEIIEMANRLGGIGVVVQDYREFARHPQVAAMELLVTPPGAASPRRVSLPWKFDGRRPACGSPPAMDRWDGLVEGWVAASP